jgi:HK97 gp10 family phage protein
MSRNSVTRSSLEGTDVFYKKLGQLKKKTQGPVLGQAVLDGSRIVERATKQKCPVRTGNLRASYRSEITVQKSDYAESDTGTNVEYAPPVEFGTEFQEAQPHLRPAFDENVDRMQRAVGLSLRRQIESV